ncbi:hypothetical protein [Enterococcus sp. LJL90]
MKKINMESILFIICYVIVGVLLGIFIGMMTGDGEITPIDFLLAGVFFMVSIVLHIIIHEAGHLTMGLLTGYKFLSFRIFSWRLVKHNNNMILSRQKIPGTLGQCLLIPPKKENFVYKLYLSGGVLFNFLASLLMISLVPIFPIFSSIFFGIGCVFGLMNLIPSGFNDGSTFKIANSSVENQDLLFLQLDSNAQMTLGKKYRDLPNAYFKLIAENPEHSYFNDYQKFLIFGRDMEKRDWAEVILALEGLWQDKEDLVLPYQLELKKEMLSYLLIRRPEDERLAELIKDKQLNRYLE